MEPHRWTRLQQLFGQALTQPEADRAAFVAGACGDDEALRDALQRLLAADREGDAPVSRAIGDAAARWARADRDSRVDQRLGPWRILAHLADGGMGAVYRAERADGRYTQQVAIKLLNPAHVSDAARARLEAERQILARLEHPNIARLLDGGSSDDGVPYLVMEFVDGQAIDTWCTQQRADTAQRLRLVLQVCRAVEHAHRNLVVHRDLKPGNILVDGAGQPRLLDFGIAKLVDGAPGVTRTGERVLTPSHASPEQVLGGAITTATDVYALGVLLYELLTGVTPHGGSDVSAATLARLIVEAPPARPSEVARRNGHPRRARDLAGDLDNIVLMALRKEPERRYASAAALAEDLERHLAHLPVRARPDTLGYRADRFVRRHRVAVPLSALGVALMLGGATLFTLRLADERDRALAAEAQAQAAAQSANRAAAFSASILERTGANRDAARRVSVQDLLDSAAARVGAELGGEPELATRVRLALGQALSSWGAYAEARQALQLALEETRTRGAAGDHDQALVLMALSTVVHDLGELETALDLSRQAEALMRRVGTPAEHAAALRDLALSLNALRRRTEAEPVFRKALAAMRRVHPGDHEDIAWLLNNLAWGLHAMGRLDEAAPIYAQALAMDERLGTPTVDRMQTQSNYAGLQFDRGDLAAAQRLWDDTLAQYEAVYGPDGHAAVARTQNLLGWLAMIRGDSAQALAWAERALITMRREVGEQHRWTAAGYAARAEALLHAGRLDAAERDALRAQSLRRQLLAAQHAGHVQPLIALAQIDLARGRRSGDATAWVRAERHAREALAMIASLSSPDRVRTEEVELSLAEALARQGRLDAGRAVAARALQRLQAERPAGHWRRREVEALVGLPPFVAAPDAAALALARATRDALRGELGPAAPSVARLSAGLGEAGAEAAAGDAAVSAD